MSRLDGANFGLLVSSKVGSSVSKVGPPVQAKVGKPDSGNVVDVGSGDVGSEDVESPIRALAVWRDWSKILEWVIV